MTSNVNEYISRDDAQLTDFKLKKTSSKFSGSIPSDRLYDGVADEI